MSIDYLVFWHCASFPLYYWTTSHHLTILRYWSNNRVKFWLKENILLFFCKIIICNNFIFFLHLFYLLGPNLTYQMPVLPSYRNQSIELHNKSIDWFLYKSNTDIWWVNIVNHFKSVYSAFLVMIFCSK